MSKRSELKRARRLRTERTQRDLRERAEHCFFKAHLALKEGRLDDAGRWGEKALRIAPDHRDAHALLADIYFNRRRDYARAASHFRSLIDGGYDNPTLPYFLAVCYFEAGQYQKARDTVTAFLEGMDARRLPGRHGSFKAPAERLIKDCDHALALKAWQARCAEVLEDVKPEKPPRQTEETSRPEAAAEPAPEPAYRELEVRFSFEDGGLLDRLRDSAPGSIEDLSLVLDYHELTLLGGFDDLLCLPHLRDVDRHPYQIDTVKKVLKHFRGRALLADEVGLGKTIEAGMVIKEYLLRGLAGRVLILVPAALLSQWQEEMRSKFDLAFTTTDEPACRKHPEKFWRETPFILASLQLARAENHIGHVTSQEFDLVVVDEAHSLKNRRTSNWKLANALKKKFIILLSATPVQNNLVELYNLITLLKPGLLQTEARFKREYLKRGDPRTPINSGRLREILREVMVRNTRSLVSVKLPRRFAATIAVPPSEPERAMYERLSRFVRENYRSPEGLDTWTLMTLQEEAGSSPFAVRATVERLLGTASRSPEIEEGLREIRFLAQEVKTIEKGRNLLDLIQKNRSKIAVFTKYLPTIDYLTGLLEDAGVAHSIYRGGMPAAEKDRAIAAFREGIDVLLATESGGEGHNLQFASTIVNFDLPWNPMRIEQRIGRLHRLGQTRDVYVFNLCLEGSIEDHMLRQLDRKINMFELVVGEIGTILGNLDREADFGQVILDLWARSQSPEEVERNFDEFGDRLLAAKGEYEETRKLDQEIFGEDFEI